MGSSINDDFLHTLLFKGDQAVVALDKEDSNYLIRMSNTNLGASIEIFKKLNIWLLEVKEMLIK